MQWALLLVVVVSARRDGEERNVRRRDDDDKEGAKKGRQWRLSGGFEYHPGDPVAVVANKVDAYILLSLHPYFSCSQVLTTL